MKFKKLWILYDGEEKIEELEEDYNIRCMGNIGDYTYTEENKNINGTYIMIPNEEKIDKYRNILIQYLVQNEQVKIDNSKEKIFKLLNKIQSR